MHRKSQAASAGSLACVQEGGNTSLGRPVIALSTSSTRALEPSQVMPLARAQRIPILGSRVLRVL